MANRRFIDFPIATTVGANDIILIWQDGLNKQTTKATILSGLPEDLEDLADVNISGLTNGQILRYDSTTGKWINTDQGNLDLGDLNDVSIVSPSNGQVLVYNSSTSKWENSSAGFVPYTGAVTTVNLGAQTIQAGSFVKAGGTSAQFLKADGSIDSNTYGTGTVTSVGLTMPAAFSVANSPVTGAGTLAVTGAGTSAQYIRGDGTLATFPALTGFVPYTGATADVNLGTHDLAAERGTFANNGSSDTLTVNHTSGSGYGIIVTKGGNNEALYVSKTSGSGNAMTVVGGRTSLVDLALSSVTNTAGDFLTLSGGVVHKRTAAQTLTDIGGQAALTNPVTGTGTTNYLPKFTGASTIGNSNLTDGGVTILNENPTAGQFAWQFNGNTTTGQSFGASVVAGTNSSDISFRVLNAAANSTYFSIRGNGNTLIGTATDAGFKLDVNGTGRFNSTVDLGTMLSVFYADISTGNNRGIKIVNTDPTYGATYNITVGRTGVNNGDFTIRNSSTGVDNLFFNRTTGAATFSSSVTAASGIFTGDVGIGTITPSTWATKLVIYNNQLTVTGGGYDGTFSDSIFFGGNSEGTTYRNKISNSLSANANFQKMKFSVASGASTFADVMTLVGSGNVGIGTTAPGAKLEVRGSTAQILMSQDATHQMYFGVDSSYGEIQAIRSGIAFDKPLILQRQGGNVLIGTTTDGGARLRVNGDILIPADGRLYGNSATVTGSRSYLELYNSATGNINLVTGFSTASIVFATQQGTERMRITSGGDLYVGSTTEPGAGSATTGCALAGVGAIIAQRNGAPAGYFGRGTNDGILFEFLRGTTLVGSISVTTSTTSYNTSSDYRLKEDLKEIKGLEKLQSIKVYNYKWKSSNDRMDGVLAHELAEVLPYAVTGQKDGEQMQGVDYSKIVPLLIQSIKELKQEIDTLKN